MGDAVGRQPIHDRDDVAIGGVLVAAQVDGARAIVAELGLDRLDQLVGGKISSAPSDSLPSLPTVTTTGSLGSSGRAAFACGRSTFTPAASKGAVTMKMINSTSITSTSGVTLMSACG